MESDMEANMENMENIFEIGDQITAEFAWNSVFRLLSFKGLLKFIMNLVVVNLLCGKINFGKDLQRLANRAKKLGNLKNSQKD